MHNLLPTEILSIFHPSPEKYISGRNENCNSNYINKEVNMKIKKLKVFQLSVCCFEILVKVFISKSRDH